MTRVSTLNFYICFLFSRFCLFWRKSFQFRPNSTRRDLNTNNAVFIRERFWFLDLIKERRPVTCSSLNSLKDEQVSCDWLWWTGEQRETVFLDEFSFKHFSSFVFGLVVFYQTSWSLQKQFYVLFFVRSIILSLKYCQQFVLYIWMLKLMNSTERLFNVSKPEEAEFKFQKQNSGTASTLTVFLFSSAYIQ